jgi:predicted amidophosphoribosyltransferase
VTYEELVALTDALVGELVPMPRPAPDVCPHCHSARDETQDFCGSCSRVLANFGHPCPTVLPISYYMTPAEGLALSPMRERMHDYKEHEDPVVRARAAREVGAILTRYIVDHGPRLQQKVGGWDELVTVPSKRSDGPSALAIALAPFADQVGKIWPALEAGPGEIRRASPNADGFRTTRSVQGVRVLLLDDTFTTGATLHSAAHALRAHGATVGGAIVVARKINPDPRWPNTENVWGRQTAHRFSFTARQYWDS